MGGSRAIRGAAAGTAALLLLVACGSSSAPSSTVPDAGINKIGATVFAPSGRTTLSAISGKTLSGTTLALTSLRGHVVVLNVWASWCVPCKAESPALVQVQRATAADGVDFVGVDENDLASSAKAFLKSIGSDYPNLVDPEGQLLAQLRLLPPDVPGSLVLDRKGRVAARVIGPTTAAQMTALVQQVVSGG